MSKKALYRKTVDGAINVWTIRGSEENSAIFIEYGQLGGGMIAKAVKVTTNNSGRTLREQIILEIKSRISKQRAKGYRDTVEDANTFEHKNELNFHKPMLAQRHDKIPNLDIERFLCQFKYDGHRCLITRHEGKLIAYSRNGKEIDTIDHILEHIDIEDGQTLDGELYVHGQPLQTIASWVKRQQPDTKKVKYIVYDIVQPGGYGDRYNTLVNFQFSNPIFVADTVSIQDLWKDELSLQDVLSNAINQGYEGLILRSPHGEYEAGKRSRNLIKVKQTMDDEFFVSDILQSSDNWAILECNTAEGKSFRVSAPGTIENKKDILENKDKYIGQHIRVEFFSITKEGIPFHPVATYWRNKEDE